MYYFHRIFLPVWTQNELASAAGSVGGVGVLELCFVCFAQASVSGVGTIFPPGHLELGLVSFASEHPAVSFFAAVHCGTENEQSCLQVKHGAVAAAVGTSDAVPACVQFVAALCKDCCYEEVSPAGVVAKAEGADSPSDSAQRLAAENCNTCHFALDVG